MKPRERKWTVLLYGTRARVLVLIETAMYSANHKLRRSVLINHVTYDCCLPLGSCVEAAAQTTRFVSRLIGHAAVTLPGTRSLFDLAWQLQALHLCYWRNHDWPPNPKTAQFVYKHRYPTAFVAVELLKPSIPTSSLVSSFTVFLITPASRQLWHRLRNHHLGLPVVTVGSTYRYWFRAYWLLTVTSNGQLVYGLRINVKSHMGWNSNRAAITTFLWFPAKFN